MNYDKLLPIICLGPTLKVRQKFFRHLHKYPNITEYINSRYEDSKSIKESLSRMKFNCEVKPICKHCGKPIEFRGIKNNKINWAEYCSISCGVYGTERIRKNTCLSKYGVDNPWKSNEIKDKIKKTCLDKYGVDNPWKCEEIRQKSKRTMLERYGVENNWESKEIVNKWQDTLEQNYGVRIPCKSSIILEKMKSTNLEKYGSEYTFSSKSIRTKIENTFIKKYGVAHPLQNEGIYKKTQCNGSHSKLEDELYLYIKEKFPNVCRQYKDKERYPWYCDFYIPELDYFIELQGYYTHGKHPYDPNSKSDLELVEQYKEKYGPECQVITIWTIKDVEKRNCAKEHNLNFKEVWSLKEGKEFIDSL